MMYTCSMNIRQCCDCQDGEHDNYDDDVKSVVIRDPDTNQVEKRGFVCWHHRAMYEMDGYEVIE